MKIIDVIPIAKGIPQEKLSYFTSKDVSVGALVSVPVKKKEIPAIVSAVSDAKESKTSLKGSDFSIKPVKSVISDNFITPEFLEACKEIAEYYLSTPGSVIKDFVPQAILESGSEPKINKTPEQTSNKREIIVIQSPTKERFQHYKSIVREELAKNKSVFLCLPTVVDMENIAVEIGRGIEKYVFVLSGKMPKKKMEEEWEKIVEEKHPVLIIATKLFMSIPRRDFGAIIIDQESSSAYKNRKKPYTDARKSAEIISDKIKARLIFGDELVLTETFYRQESGEFSPSFDRRARLISSAEQIIIDAKEYFEEKKTNQRKFVSTPRLMRIMDEAIAKNEKIIIFANRKGYHPTTICADCGRTILCGKCDAPVVMRKTDSKNAVQRCHKCLSELPAPDKCPYCKSWRLESYGIGTQMVAEEMKGFFPDAKIFEMDSDSVPNEKAGKKIAEEFLLNGGILVGTEMIFSYINRPVDRVIAISVDGLFTLPEFKMNEKVFHLLLKLKSLAKKSFIIQTRFPELPIFDNVLRGNISGFYKEEIASRKIFQYPPFKLLIKITKEGKNENQLNKEMEALQKILDEWKPATYPAFIPKVKNLYIKHILLKIDSGSWPSGQEKLRQILSSLPPSWKIDIGPESLL
ncbi:MAG: Primosomal protein N [Parcubacteria group bacterium GW2011_GWB1_43_8]|nr:MAG: Primosomal protein N [Parcubacteria group bacterium GW2011_GWB1_43_8]